MTILEFTKRTLRLKLSRAQKVLLSAIYGLPLAVWDRSLFREAAGVDYPAKPYKIVDLIAGRRAGKSSRCALPVALYEALCVEREVPANEIFWVAIVAPTAEQSDSTFSLIASTVRNTPELLDETERIADSANEQEIVFKNRRGIKVLVANLRTVRSLTCCCVIAEESAFFQADPDSERTLQAVLESLMPSMSTVPDSKLITMSSPWTKSGRAYENFINRAETPHRLVWKLPSREMNPLVTAQEIELFRKEFGDAAARREYDAAFTDEAGGFLEAAWIDKAKQPDETGEGFLQPTGPVYAAVDMAQFSDHLGAAAASADESGVVTLIFAEAEKPVDGKIAALPALRELAQAFNDLNVVKVFSDRVSSTTVEGVMQEAGIPYERVDTMGLNFTEVASHVQRLFRDGMVRVSECSEVFLKQAARAKLVLQPNGGMKVECSGHDDALVAGLVAIFQASKNRPSGSGSWIEVLDIDPQPFIPSLGAFR